MSVGDGTEPSRRHQAFLIDGVGALVSAVMLGAVLPLLGERIGMPRGTLFGLATVAVVFAGYSLTCHRRAQPLVPWLVAIALANLAYCALTLALVVHHVERLGVLGLMYFVGEIAVVLALVVWELRVAFASR